MSKVHPSFNFKNTTYFGLKVEIYNGNYNANKVGFSIFYSFLTNREIITTATYEKKVKNPKR